MIKPSNFLLLRAPLNSLNQYSNCPIEDITVLKDALQLAAPDFLSELKKIGDASEKEKTKLYETLYKYWLRSCTRCTPYGFFAGSTIIDINDKETNIVIDSKSHKKKVRLDMSYLFLLKTEIEKIPKVLNQLRFSINNSLYETALDYRYAESYMVNETRYYKLSSVKKSEYLSFLLSEIKRIKSLNDLIERFTNEFPSFSREDTRSFLMEMWSSQLLVNDLELILTGIDPLQNLIKTLENYEGIEEIIAKLKQIDSLLNDNLTKDYDELINKIKSVFDIKQPTKDIIQIDLFLATNNRSINKGAIEKIVSQAEDLFGLFRIRKNPRLELFIKNFIDLYEGQELPLNFVLDDDLGIGYNEDENSPTSIPSIIKGIPVFQKTTNLSNGPDYIAKYILSKYQDFIEGNQEHIEIKEDEMIDFKKDTIGKKFATSQFLFGSLFKNNNVDIEEFLFDINTISGPSAANLFGRFTLGNKEISDLIRNEIEQEEQEYPNAIFAEIVHIPQSRLGNVLLRSNLRKYEIPYLGKSGINEEFQIPVSDIAVSVIKGEVILRSVKHNKRIFPRLSTAHNFDSNLNLPIYRFLCDLQTHRQAVPIIWDWGVLSAFKYLPRVIYKNLILQKARWLIEDKEINSFTGIDLKNFSSFLKTRNLPPIFLLTQGDNQLLINTNDERALKILFDATKKHKVVVLQEFLFKEDNCILSDTNANPYTNEVVVPIFRKNHINEDTYQIDAISKNTSIQKIFPPGSDWFYIKLYGGEKSLESILLNEVFEFINSKEILFEKFFYVRLIDKLGKHLRLRFFKLEEGAKDKLLNIIGLFLNTNQLRHILIDSYEREIHRYGANLIEHVETLSHHDSFTILRLNKLLLEVEEVERYRLLFALRSVDVFLEDFGFNNNQKLILLKKISSAFFAEFGGSSTLRSTLNLKFRERQKDIFAHMNSSLDEKNEINEVINFFNDRSKLTSKTISDIKIILREEGADKIDKLVINCIHMSLNRLMTSNQRMHELLIYTLLERYYSSLAAISKRE